MKHWEYLGVGCLTAVIGFAGGGMIAVLLARVIGAAHGCTLDAETGAPCAWASYWVWGAGIGLVLVPTVAITLLSRGRRRAAQFNKEGNGGAR
jgi:hypothetical protein